MPDLKLLDLAGGQLQGRPDFEMSFDGAGFFSDGPVILEGHDVAVQDVVRGISTRKGTNPFSPNYGTTIPDRVGSRNVGGVSSAVASDVQYLLGYLAQLSAQDPPAEQISELVSLSVKSNKETLEVNLTVRTADAATLTTTVPV